MPRLMWVPKTPIVQQPGSMNKKDKEDARRKSVWNTSRTLTNMPPNLEARRQLHAEAVLRTPPIGTAPPHKTPTEPGPLKPTAGSTWPSWDPQGPHPQPGAPVV
jgi:hypothetical protein